jgi:hypothetical protein
MLERLDGWQQRRRGLSFLVAIFVRYREDRGREYVYERIPVIGTQLRANASSIPSSGVALLIGVVVSLWAGLVVVRRAQDALNLQWGVPWFRRERRGPDRVVPGADPVARRLLARSRHPGGR